MTGTPVRYEARYRLLKRHVASLNALIEDGSFFRLPWRQRRILTGRVARRYRQLAGRTAPNALKGALVGVGLLSIAGFQSPGAVVNLGEATPRFEAPVRNPFGLPAANNYFDAVRPLADIDGDGDLDMLMVNVDPDADPYAVPSASTRFRFYLNSGTARSPIFSSDAFTTIRLPGFMNRSDAAYLLAPTLVDLDGDVDIVASVIGGGGVVFAENTGTELSAVFGKAQLNRFGLPGAGTFFSPPSFADMDGDGDADMLLVQFGESGETVVYHENTGTNRLPQFGPGLSNLFGLRTVPSSAPQLTATMVDLDNDRDVDILLTTTARDTEPYTLSFQFVENISTSQGRSFRMVDGASFGLQNPLVATDTVYFAPNVTAVDIDSDGDLDLFIGGALSKFDFMTATFESDLFFFENTGSR